MRMKIFKFQLPNGKTMLVKATGWADLISVVKVFAPQYHHEIFISKINFWDFLKYLLTKNR